MIDQPVKTRKLLDLPKTEPPCSFLIHGYINSAGEPCVTHVTDDYTKEVVWSLEENT